MVSVMYVEIVNLGCPWCMLSIVISKVASLSSELCCPLGKVLKECVVTYVMREKCSSQGDFEVVGIFAGIK